ncbi:MAG: alcohol dehydrogenase catalytic domain-containing protein [Patescibacteria group bacterium]|jgi:threonine 3-dehydrogenase
MTNIQALTLDLKQDGWSTSKGFIKRPIAVPTLTEATHVLVKVKYAGVCGSDRGIWNRVAFSEVFANSLDKQHKTLRILGHEFVGEVTAAGEQVEKLYGIKVGDTVSGDSHVTCGNCYQCKLGEAEVCQDQAILGISTDGIFAEQVNLPAKNLWPIDLTKLRPEIAAICDPFGNAVHSLSKVDVRGKQVVIYGCGQIGMFAILLARQFGASQVIGVDTNQHNLDIAKQLGAHQTVLIQPKGDSQACAEVLKLTAGRGADITMEMAGFNSSVNNCIATTRFGGEVILFGIKDGDFTINKFSGMIMKGLTLHCVIGRQIFKTWQTIDSVLSDKSNGVQDKIWNIILNGGKDTVIKFSEYTPELMEQRMRDYPKLIFDVQN